MLGRFDAQLLVDVHAPEYHDDIRDGDAELTGEKSHHVIGRLAADRRGRYADFKLMTFGFADDILFRAGFAEYVEYQRVAVPAVKGAASRLDGWRCGGHVGLAAFFACHALPFGCAELIHSGFWE
jgi:hypothetical protein